jgi:hypothetical protein
MNIFFLDPDPRKCAQYHLDKHVVKMILETAQMLYSVHWVLELELPEIAYKKTHINHPCSIWARTSVQNYKWLCELGKELCREYTFRYSKVHKTEKHIVWLDNNIPDLPGIDFTEPAQAMPVEYKHADPVCAYRTFYIKNKMGERGITKYTKRPTPIWTI